MQNADIYNVLDGDVWAMSDDKAWNEMVWISDLNDKLSSNDHDNENEIDSDDTDDFIPNPNANNNKFKQCRYRNRIQECAHFDINKKIITFSLRVPKSMQKRDENENESPSNFNDDPAAKEELSDFYDYGYLFPLQQSLMLPPNNVNMGINGLAQTQAVPGMHGGAMAGIGGMYGQKRNPQTGHLDPSKLCEPTNSEEVGAEMGYQDFYEMKDMVGHQDPCNLRRRRLLMNEGEESADIDYETYGDDVFDDDDDSFMDIVDENDGYDFDKQFEYGDLLGFTLWTRNKIKRNMINSAAHEMDDNELSDYESYGDYMYYFDEYSFDFDDESEDKCSMVIPGLQHKLCFDHDRENDMHKIQFSAASTDEMDNTYYHLYGFDEYYYNDNDDDENNNNADEFMRRQLSSEEEEVPFGYDAAEYYDGNNGYDEEHPREGFVDRTAARRRYQLDKLVHMQHEQRIKKQKEYAMLKQQRDERASMHNMNPMMHPMAMHMQHPMMAYQRRRRQMDENDDDDNDSEYDYYDVSSFYEDEDDDDQNEYYVNSDDDNNEDEELGYAMDYFSNFYQQLNEQENIFNSLKSELSDLLLSFDDNSYWDEMTKINQRNDAFSTTAHSIRKCKSLQSMQLCATKNTNSDDNKLKINLKIGRHKYHKSDFYRSSAYQDMLNEYKELSQNADDNNMDEVEYDLNVENAEDENAVQSMHWVMNNDVMDVMGDEWNDPIMFKPTHLITHSGREMIRKCKNSFCLCQYINYPNSDGLVHPCKPAIKADKSERLGPADLMQLMSVMDTFLAPIHILSTMASSPSLPSVPSMISNRKMPLLHISLNPRPMLQRMPYSHILKLRSSPPLNMFHSKIINHKYRIPWNRYRKFAHLIPKTRPFWLPQWIWHEVNTNMKTLPSAETNAKAKVDYYDYDEELADYYDDLEDKKLRKSLLAKYDYDFSNYYDDDYDEDSFYFNEALMNQEGGWLSGIVSAAKNVIKKIPVKKIMDKGKEIFNKVKKSKAFGQVKEIGANFIMGGASAKDTLNALRNKGNQITRETIARETLGVDLTDQARNAQIQANVAQDMQAYAKGRKGYEEHGYKLNMGENAAGKAVKAKGGPTVKAFSGQKANDFEKMAIKNYKKFGADKVDRASKMEAFKTGHGKLDTSKFAGLNALNLKKKKAQDEAIKKAAQEKEEQDKEDDEQNEKIEKQAENTQVVQDNVKQQQQALRQQQEQQKDLAKNQGILQDEINQIKKNLPSTDSHNVRRLIDDLEESDILDGWIDEESNSEWIVLNNNVNDDFDYLDFEDDDIWDEIIENIETLKGRPLSKKCMNIFGRQLCICEFMDWLNGKVIGGDTKHICYSPKLKGTAIKTEGQKNKNKKKVVRKIKAKKKKEEKTKEKKVEIKKLKVNQRAQKKVEDQHKDMMKKHEVLMRQMKQLSNLMKRVRKQKNGLLPERRPVWLPHYFWHWMHHFPHFHQLHLNKRMPWIASSAHVDAVNAAAKIIADKEEDILSNEYDHLFEFDSAESAKSAQSMESAESQNSEIVSAHEEIIDDEDIYDKEINDNYYFESDEDFDDMNAVHALMIEENGYYDDDKADEKEEYFSYAINHAQSVEEEEEQQSVNLDAVLHDESEEKEQEKESLLVVGAEDKNVNNPYFTIELIFLMLCGLGLVALFIYVQKQEWIETLKRLNEERINKRKYGFNRINVVFDTELSDSDDSNDCCKHIIDPNLSLSGDEDLNHESINVE